MIWPTYAAPQQGGEGTTGSSTYVPPAVTTPAGVVTGGTVPSAGATTGGVPGGRQIDIGVSTGLTYDSNFGLVPNPTGGSTVSDTTLSLAYSDITPTSNLQISGSSVLRFGKIPGRTVSGFEDPTFTLDYTRDWSNARLTFNLGYRHVDREFLDPFTVAQEQISTGLIGSGGTLTSKTAAFSLETGLNDPIGYLVSLSHDSEDYNNTGTVRLYDSVTDSISGSIFFRPSQTTQWSLNAAFTKYDAQDVTFTRDRTRDLSVGLKRDLSPTLVMDLNLGYSVTDTDQLINDPILGLVPFASRQSGAVGSFSLLQTRVNGTAGVNLSLNQTDNGSYTSLSFSRDLQLPRGNLAASLGAVRTESGRTDWIGTLAYSHQMPSSVLTVSFDRAVSTNSLNEDVLDTVLGVSYDYSINANSSLGLAFDWAQSTGAGLSVVPTIERASVTASYTRALTQDWNLTGGVQLQQSDETGVGRAHSNSVFVTLGRTFSFRP